MMKHIRTFYQKLLWLPIEQQVKLMLWMRCHHTSHGFVLKPTNTIHAVGQYKTSVDGYFQWWWILRKKSKEQIKATQVPNTKKAALQKAKRLNIVLVPTRLQAYDTLVTTLVRSSKLLTAFAAT
jgi:hypothetical protein